MKLDIKKNLYPLTLAVVVIIVALSIWGTGGADPVVNNIPVRDEEPANVIEDDTEKICRESGGVWEKMPTPCKGTCDYERKVLAGQGPLCAQVITPNCDCGEGQCWNGSSCEEI